MDSWMTFSRGIDIPQINDVLQRLQENPEALAQRRQYSDSPPPYPSGETTQPPSPAPLPSENDRRIQRRNERNQSRPYLQYDYQWGAERERIIEQISRRRERRKETLPYDRNLDFNTNAKNNVKNRWIEQGIWNDKWTGYPGGSWKHEDPPEPEPQQPTKPRRSTMIAFGHIDESKLERPKVVSKKQRAAHERETAASRPYHQFRYQNSKEREWIEDDTWGNEFNGAVDVDAIAYKNIKNSWIKQKIWNPRWGDMPGMTWMHEEPDMDESGVLSTLRADQAEETQTGKAGTGEQPLDSFTRHRLLDPPLLRCGDDNNVCIETPNASNALQPTKALNNKGSRQAVTDPALPKRRFRPRATNSRDSDGDKLHKVKAGSVRKSGRLREKARKSKSFGKNVSFHSLRHCISFRLLFLS